MRKIILLNLIFIFAGSIVSNAQSLTNTSWKGYFPDPLHDTITIHFKTDSSFVTTSDGNTVVNSVNHISGDTLSFEDYAGMYACTSMTGRYTFAIANNKLSFKLVDDPCDGRQAIAAIEWLKVDAVMPKK